MRYFITLLVCCYTFSSFAQKPANIYTTALDSFSFLHPTENIYVATSQEELMQGETLWGKLWITLNGVPSPLSKVVYVEFSNDKHVLIEKQMLKVELGSTHFNIDIKKDLPEGKYFLNAYSLWMLNFPQDIYHKEIVVNDKYISGKKTIATNNFTKWQCNFFPEGGNLIEGLPTKLAFKATDENGYPINVSGKINNIIFQSTHDGMGVLDFIPSSKEANKIEVIFNGNNKTFTLPSIKMEGITMVTTNADKKIFVALSRAEQNKAAYNNITIIAKQYDEIVYTGQCNFDEGQDALAITKKDLKPGVLHITAFTQSGIPIAERLVFIKDRIAIETPTTKVEKEDGTTKVTIAMPLTDFNNLDAVAYITKQGLTKSNQNIYSETLLAPYLKGTVYNPIQYFANNDELTNTNLDLVMLTNGWRKFTWQEILNPTPPKFNYYVESGISLTGKLQGGIGKKHVDNGRVNVIIKGEDSTNILSQALTDANDHFVINNINILKSATVLYQGSNAKNVEALVNTELYPRFFDTLKLVHKPITLLLNNKKTSTYYTNLQNINGDATKIKTLQEVKVSAKRISKEDSVTNVYASNIYSNSDQTLIPLENAAYYDIFQYLQQQVPGITVARTDSGPQVFFNRFTGADFFSENISTGVQFFLNELPTDISFIEALDVNDIAMVKVYKGITGYILGASRGAIGIYTKKGVSTKKNYEKGFNTAILTGYTFSRTFAYSQFVMLEDSVQAKNTSPVIYWNPKLTLKNNQIQFAFGVDESLAEFILTIEGIDKNGKLLSIIKEMKL